MRFLFFEKLPVARQVITLVTGMSTIKLSVAAAVLVVAGSIVTYVLVSNPDAHEPTSFLPLVEVASVETLSAGSSGLPLLGQVRSVSEATILTEAQGQITRVNYAFGDFVTAGAIIAEISNASERAALAQARAFLAEKEAQIARTGATTESSARNVYRSSFITADDAVQNKTEPFFLKDRTQFPSLLIALPNEEPLERARAEITEILRVWEREIGNLTDVTDVLSLLSKARTDLTFIESFLTELASAANRRTNDPSSLAITDADRLGLQTARSSVSTTLGTLIATEDTLREARLGTAVGATGEQEAQLTSARAQVSVAVAALERTIVRAPIGGTINSINLKLGNFVSAQTPAVTIANNNALEIETAITAKDREHVAIGSSVIIDGRYRGTVTNVAPGLDPLTNKITVEIGIEGEAPGLTHGDTVRLSIQRNALSEGRTPSNTTEFMIPIAALKVETDRIVVFSVSNDGVLVAHPIVEGPLVGGSIVIKGGITPDLEIVLDARGLNEGDVVEIAD
jgi:multidrug resistance efflux pump